MFKMGVLIYLVACIVVPGQEAAKNKTLVGTVVAYDALLAQENPSAIPFIEMYLFKISGSDKIVKLKFESSFEGSVKNRPILGGPQRIKVNVIRDRECDSTLSDAAFARSVFMDTQSPGPRILRLKYLDTWRPARLRQKLKCYKVNDEKYRESKR